MTFGIVIENYLPHRMGGIENYLESLLKVLPTIDNTNEYLLFIPKKYSKQLEVPEKVKKVHLRSGFSYKVFTRLKLAKLLKISNLDLINNKQVDLLHFPLQIIQPEGIKGKKVISIMDIQHCFYPEFFSDSDLQVRNKLYTNSIKEADHIISISNFTKNTLIDKYQIESSKITTIHLAAGLTKFDSNPTKLEGLPTEYIYYPAASWPHKNHMNLLEAFTKVISKLPSLNLVLSGLNKNNAEINEKIHSLGIDRKVVQLGYISKNQQTYVFQNAKAMIFPSLFEGFGIPILEAMSQNCPVACSNTTSLPEVAGNAALYFNPTSKNEIANAIYKMSINSKLRQSLIHEGKKQVKKFSVEKMAKETANLFARLHEQN